MPHTSFKRLLCWLLLLPSVSTIPQRAAAQPRAWNSADGKFRTNADLLRADGEGVWLKTGAGKELRVLRAKLSDNDCRYVGDWLAARGQSGDPRTLLALEKRANACSTAQAAAKLYVNLLTDSQTPTGLKWLGEPAARRWRRGAVNGAERVGVRWLTHDAAQAQRREAANVRKQGLELLRIGSTEEAIHKLKEASRIDPDNVDPSLSLAMLHLRAKRWADGERFLRECAASAPESAWVQNDLAIAQVLQWKLPEASQSFVAAASLSIGADDKTRGDVAHNLARFLRFAGKLSKSARFRGNAELAAATRAAADAYSRLVVNDQAEAGDPKGDWRFMYPRDSQLGFALEIPQPEIEPPAEDAVPKAAPAEPSRRAKPPAAKPERPANKAQKHPDLLLTSLDDDKRVAEAVGLVVMCRRFHLPNKAVIESCKSTGTCFAVSPDGYLLTNKHVVDSAFAKRAEKWKANDNQWVDYEVEEVPMVFFEGVPYEAKVIHVSPQFDLAVLKIDRAMPQTYFALSRCKGLKRRLEVEALGYPGVAQLPGKAEGAALEAQRIAKIEEAFRNPLKVLAETELPRAAFDYMPTFGQVTQLHEREGKQAVYHEARIFPGDSGGPLVSTALDCAVIGINTEVARDADGNLYRAYTVQQFQDEIDHFIPVPVVWHD